MATPRRAAFTLMEVMVSVAIALVLILGINEVFSLTAKTVGAGTSLTNAYQGSRSAQAVIASDFRQAAPMSSAPCFIIESATRYGFRNRADFNSDADGNVTTSDPGSVNVPPNALTARAHRSDRIGFFARGLFARQTGSGTAFIDTVTQGGMTVPVTSSEAWIVYGHLNVPDNSGSTSANTFPGAGTAATNPNNFFAGQWVLGRNVFLLIPNPPTGGYYVSGSATLSPLGYGSTAQSGGATIDSSRYDVAQTSINLFSQQLTTFVGVSSGADYWTPLVANTGARFVGNPLPFKGTGGNSGIGNAAAAAVAPCFLTGCTQFLVEFAGDFITQDPTTGAVQGAGSDGTIDYQIVNGVRQIRWYGFPRSTSGDPAGIITANNDVVPVRDVVGLQPFERVLPHAVASGAYGGMTSTDRYVVAWGPDTQTPAVASVAPSPTPTMLRFTVSLDDMTNRTGGAQTFEYVVQLQQ